MKSLRLTDRLLLLILAVAAVLRLFHLFQIPFMYDELSAVMRAQADSFSSLIDKARDTDVHPVGVHVFLHYWTALAGQREWVIKLPFIIMSIASVWVAFRIAGLWFGETTALLTSASMAGLQYFVMYGQLARPYAAGLFFTMLMVWCWTNYLSSYRKKWLAGFVVSAALCCYTHYFCLLFAFIVAASGILFCKKEKWLEYIVSCFVVALLFIPHLAITLHQFGAANNSDSKWIPRPGPEWLYHFLKYLFHYSRALYVALAIVIVASVAFSRGRPAIGNKYRILCVVWFLLPFLLIFMYSVYREPALQLSSLMFCTPFLLMALLSFAGELSPPARLVLPMLLLASSVYTLVHDRRHYTLFYEQPYEQMAIMSTEAIHKYGEAHVATACSIMEGFMDYYQKKYGPFEFYRVQPDGMEDFHEYLEKCKADVFVAGNLDDEYISVIREKFPYLLKKKEGFTMEVYCFGKQAHEELQEHPVYDSRNFITKGCSEFWFNKANKMEIDSANEYPCNFSGDLSAMINSRYNVLRAQVALESADSLANPVLVMEISSGGRQVAWRGSEMKKFSRAGKGNLYVSVPLRDLDPEVLRKATVKVYIWNRDHKQLTASNGRVLAVPANPYIYGLYEPFK